MEKYLLVESKTGGGNGVYSELIPINGRDLMEIAPVVSAIGKTPNVDKHEMTGYEMYGHIDGFEKFIGFVPKGKDGVHNVKSMKVLMVSDILI